MTDPSPPDVESLLSRGQVAAIYGVPESTIRTWSREGVIPAGFYIGKHLRWRREVIRDDIEQRAMKAALEAAAVQRVSSTVAASG